MRGFTVLAAGSVAANGLLVGASLDQSLKQLPARRVIGAGAYAAYARAADGSGNGIAWYATLGVGTAALTVATAAASVLTGQPGPARAAAVGAGILSLAHSLATTQAAPIMLSLRHISDDDPELAGRLDSFARWQAIRASLQLAALVSAFAAAVTSR